MDPEPSQIPSEDDQRYQKTYGIGQRTTTQLNLTTASPDGIAELQIRTEGALIQSLCIGGQTVLTGPSTTELEQPIKTDATITMLPVGPSKVGPQHGASRYLSYAIEYSTSNALRLAVQDTLRNLHHRKTITLLADELEIADAVVNTSPEQTISLSLGEHFYLPVSQSDLAGVKLLNSAGVEQSITAIKLDGTVQTSALAGFLPELVAGRSFLFEGFQGWQLIHIPGLGEIILEAYATSEGQDLPISLLIWHRPGSNTICFEPVTGFTVDDGGKPHNDGINLPPGDTMKLVSSISIRIPTNE